MLKIVVSPNAETVMIETALWYKTSLGVKARDRFVNGIRSAIQLLAEFPGVGRRADHQPIEGVVFRSYTEHKNHRIIYYVSDDTLYIADVWSTRMKH